MCSLASQTCRRTGLLNCCHGIGTIRTCRWSLELGIMLYAIRGPRRVLSNSLPVAAIERESDPDFVAIVAAQFEAIRAPTQIGVVDGDAPIMTPFPSTASMT